MILEAVKHDPECVLANVLAAHFMVSSDGKTRVLSYLDSAKSRLVRIV